MTNYMGNRKPKRMRSYSSKQSRYRQSPTGKTSNNVYSMYSINGRPSSTRVKKQMMSNSSQRMIRTRMNNTNQGLRPMEKNHSVTSHCPPGMYPGTSPGGGNMGCYDVEQPDRFRG